jgi:hypothetical protein
MVNWSSIKEDFKMSKVKLNSLVKKFGHWRKHRGSRRECTPARLRKMTVELCQAMGLAVVQRAVGISGSSILKWREEFGLQPSGVVRYGKTKVRRRITRSRQVNGLKFVDVSAAVRPGIARKMQAGPEPILPASADGGCRLEFARIDGSILRVSGISLSDISVLADKFLAVGSVFGPTVGPHEVLSSRTVGGV